MGRQKTGLLRRLVARAGGDGSFLVSAGKLLGGTAAAQAITIAALPILTRIYSPQEMAVLAAFLALHNILAVIACARLEIAIPLAPDDGDAARLTILALVATGLLTVLLILFASLSGPQLLAEFKLSEVASYTWVLPLSVAAAGAYGATQYQATRNKRFGVIARTRVVQAIASTGTQIGLGLLKVGPLGLLFGQVLMAGAGAVRLSQVWLKNKPLQGVDLSRSALADTLRRFRRFPVFSTPEAFANRGSAEIPVLIIAAFAIGPEAGFLLLAIKAMGAPLSLLGNAAAQVFMAESREALRDGRLGKLTSRVLILLAKLAVGPLIFAALISPPAFSLIFGAEWHRAGVIALWMLPWSVLKTLSSPISSVLHVQMRQRAMMALQIAGLLIRVGLTWAAAIYAPNFVVETFALASAAFYLLCLSVFMGASRLDWRGLVRGLPLPMLIIGAWSAAGVAALMLFDRLI